MNAFLEHASSLFTSQDPLKVNSWKRFQELGIPNYSYLPLSQLRNFKIASDVEEPFLQKKEDFPYTLVFVNGKFRPDLSDPLCDEVSFMPLTEAVIEYPSFLKGHLEGHLQEEKDAFALMTAALSEEPSFLYIPPYTHFKTHIINIQTSKSAFGRFEIFLGRGAEAEISLKNYAQTTESSFASELIHLHLEEEAVCYLQKTDQWQSKQWAFSFIRAFQKAKSRLHSIQVTSGALSSRQDIITTLTGPEAKAYLGGAARLKGFNQAHSNVLVRHLAPETFSEQLFKTILEDVSRSSFQGEIFVSKEALKTNAFQLSKSLLLSDKAIAYSRPQLQIFADDVKASHGSTVGQMDEEMLFYLQSRGLSKSVASAMLINSFVNDLIGWFKSPVSKSEAEKILA